MEEMENHDQTVTNEKEEWVIPEKLSIFLVQHTRIL